MEDISILPELVTYFSTLDNSHVLAGRMYSVSPVFYNNEAFRNHTDTPYFSL